MPKKVEITPKKRAVCVALKKEGLSCREIAHRVGVSKSSVDRAIQLVKKTGQYTSRKRSGRPRVTTKREDSLIRRVVQRNPFISSADVKTELPHVTASTRTIRRRLLVDFKLPCRHAARKPLLNKLQLKKRIAFCKKYKNWTVQQWRNVMFSDESTFCQFGTHVYRVRRPAGMRYDQRFTIPTMKHPQKIMVWGCFSAHGRGSIYFLQANETVTAKKYIEILQSKLPQVMNIHNVGCFQQDGAPAHTAKIVKEWLRDHDIDVLDWPGNSPDLNPIENLWELMKRRLAKRCPKNLQDVRYWLTHIWCQEISRDLCQNLVNSMPRRISDVLRRKGQQTKY
jgi:transposase